MRLGIRLSIYDDHDNEIDHAAAWVPDGDDLTSWRPAYDAICAAIWQAVGDLVSKHRFQPPLSTADAPSPSSTGVPK